MTEKYLNFLGLTIYQIYPRSFCDSNGDGIGDLQGVISKLDYLQDLGVNAIWLCPCYKSPNVDNGYDVADYRDIMDEFGTMEDIKALIAGLHQRNMKLIMDLVPNHTSDQHKWFVESRKSKDNPYSDYYYWYDTPPNDWQSAFLGSAWQYDELRGQYYLHSYAPEQPDLNWETPAVVKEMQDVVDFWVDLGVDGFRIDVIDQISKDMQGDNYFGPRLHEFINALFDREKTKHIFTVGECWADDIEEVRRHCGADRGELSTLFQFDHQQCGRDGKYTPKKQSIRDFWEILKNWQLLTQNEDLLYSLFTDNHDNSWFISRMGDVQNNRYEVATCIAALLYLMRGVGFVYQGQELGMINSCHTSIAEFDDVESINFYNENIARESTEAVLEKINFGGRDNPRRPMCWSGGENGGFTTGKPWLPVNVNYPQINLEAEKKAEKSVWRFYRDLLHLKNNEKALTLGTFRVVADADTYCIYSRTWEGKTVTVACNFENPTQIPGVAGKKLLLSNFRYPTKENDLFAPYEIAVFEGE